MNISKKYVESLLENDKDWIKNAKTKKRDYPGHEKLYTKKAEEIVKVLLENSDSIDQAIRIITFVINRSGKNLSKERRAELEKAKKILIKMKEKER